MSVSRSLINQSLPSPYYQAIEFQVIFIVPAPGRHHSFSLALVVPSRDQLLNGLYVPPEQDPGSVP